MKDPDIVTALRKMADGDWLGDPVSPRRAAGEIERLRKELDTRIAMCDMRSEKIIELTNERDEARRRLCIEWTEHGPVRLNKEQIAMRYGWDCFKEESDEQ